MNKVRTPISSRKGITISAKTRALYEARDRSLDNDPDVPTLPADAWANAMRRDEFFRPLKKAVTVRLDADVLAWLRAKDGPYQTRINGMLRAAMQGEVDQKRSK